MIELEQIVDEESKQDLSYMHSLRRSYKRFIEVSDIPVHYQQHNIDTRNLPERIQTLNDNIFNIVNNRYNFVFNVANYFDTGYLSSMLLDSYFIEATKNKQLVENIIYVDTNLLLEDYKKLMDMGGDYNMSLAHNYDTIYKNVENAAYVIWDKFSLVSSSYDRQKLYNILLIRKRKSLGNMFFIKDAKEALANICDEEMKYIMDVTQIVRLEQQKITYLQQTEKGVNMRW